MPKKYCMGCGFGSDYSPSINITICQKCKQPFVRSVARIIATTQPAPQVYQEPSQLQPDIDFSQISQDRARRRLPVTKTNYTEESSRRGSALANFDLEPIGEDEIVIENATKVDLKQLTPIAPSEKREVNTNAITTPPKRKRMTKAQKEKNKEVVAQFFKEGNGARWESS